ncbi:MAG: M23 family metallopeptidase [Anaerolineales bacterium]|nr:M23 family metallopeptidase [Anaerolineales bacterium]
MPFIAGEAWVVGAAGSFYGNNLHCNPYNDYYATDWNRAGDYGAAVLPVAHGQVSYANCDPGPGYGCNIKINHLVSRTGDYYQSHYAHLINVDKVSVGLQVSSSHLIALVGETGTTGGVHLHFGYRRLDGGAYRSLCASNCDALATPQAPQGHQPSRMLTDTGQTGLADFGTYTSVNGRLYLSDLRTGSGWGTTLYVRNNGTVPRNVSIRYYNAAGTNVSTSSCSNLAPSATCSQAAPASFQGAAHLDGAENLSAVAIVDNGTRSYAIEAVPSGTSHGGLGTSARSYIPSNLVNYYGWNSTLTVHNLNPGGVTFNAQLYDDAGVLVNWLSNVPLGPRASHTFSLNGTARGSVRVMSADYTKPIVAGVRHENAGADTIAYVGATEGGAGNFAASLFKDYWGWNSSSSTQETYDVATTVNAYYSPSGSESFNLNLAGGPEIYLGASQVFPTGQGAGRYLVSSNRRVTTAAHHAQGFWALGYPALSGGAYGLYLPWIIDGTGGWEASVTVFNPGATATWVVLSEYEAAGTPVYTYVFQLPARQSREVYSQLVAGVHSIYVEAQSAPVVAVAHATNSNGRGIGYTAVPVRAFAP